MMLKLQIQSRKKSGLLAIFITGLGIRLVSFARCKLVGVTLKGEDVTWNAVLSSELRYDPFLVALKYLANFIQHR